MSRSGNWVARANRAAIRLAVMGAVGLVPATALADGYGPAGCGLGSLIFEPNSGFTQIFAATTNGISGNQTFAISTGTLNCAGASGGSAGAKEFVETNRVALAKDIARGQGETISSLSKLAGCRDAQAVGASLQRNFQQIFPDASVSDQQVSQSVVDALTKDPALACGNLS